MEVAQVGAEESVTEEAAAGLGEAVLVTGQAVLVTEQAGAVQAEAEQAAQVGHGDQVWSRDWEQRVGEQGQHVRQQGQRVWLQAGDGHSHPQLECTVGETDGSPLLLFWIH